MENSKNVEEWNDFNSKHYQKGSEFINYSFLSQLFEQVIAKGNVRDIWFPGCGTSIVPKVFAELGFNTWATDVSDFAVAIQHEFTEKSVEQILEYGRRISVQNEQGELESQTLVNYLLMYHCADDYSFEKQGTFEVVNHDFRTSFYHAKFDCIVNIKAFQVFLSNAQRQIARVHYDALKSGGLAVFQTQNIVGKADLELKASLLNAGFHIQGFKTSSWFWNTLSEMLPLDLLHSYGVFEDYFWSDSDRQKYSKTLESLRQEFKQRSERESEETAHLLNDGETKVAKVFAWSG
ncbi:MAG: hypothetical protein DCF19_15680 [Pseudanabaena frigida]|uniref:Methyltransferase type 11 domain-containing protein n=1 Tax=Pseudanabaena frigida TaxID=945775 RepID=A0A2W4WAI1_9CYAN|nr:MAG: hypothetical protein DCF19_15680 [Pseudanabaena frigida]